MHASETTICRRGRRRADQRRRRCRAAARARRPSGRCRRDGGRRRGERREHHEARVVRRMHVDDVDAPAPEQLLQLSDHEEVDGVERLRRVAVHAAAPARSGRARTTVLLRPVVAVHDRGRQQVAGDHGHLVAAGAQMGRLAVHVLRDATQLRVVVIGDDRDPHARRGCWYLPVLGTSATRVPTSGVGGNLPGADLRVPLCERPPVRGVPAHLRRPRSRRATSAARRCRVLNAPALHFKGSGFYTTDYGQGKGGRRPTPRPSPTAAVETPRAAAATPRAAATRPRRRRATASPLRARPRPTEDPTCPGGVTRSCSPPTTRMRGQAPAVRSGPGTRRRPDGSPRFR